MRRNTIFFFRSSLLRSRIGYLPEHTSLYTGDHLFRSPGQHRLRLKESEADTTIYLGSSPDFPYVFSLNKEQWNEDVLKSCSELINRGQ